MTRLAASFLFAAVTAACFECTSTADCPDGEICIVNAGNDCIPDGKADLRDCCDCLVDFECIDVDADRCFANIDGGGALSITQGCASDRARCGVACEDVLDTE